MSEVDPRALSFGAEAATYDRARPSYPAELIDRLAAGVVSVLDIGCGTGKASRLFTARGCEVLGVEADPLMAELARPHVAAVEVARFEDWDPRGRMFDLAVSAQAWHWIDDAVGAPKVASVLPAGHRFAAIWNFPKHDPATRAALDDVYAREAPALLTSDQSLGRAGHRESLDNAVAGLIASGAFEEPTRETVAWTKEVTAAEWVEQLRTFSDHALLPTEQRESLLHAIAATIAGLGGTLTLQYTTYAVLAVRR